MSNELKMVDLSSNNGPVNLKALWHAGFRVLTLKATEGTNYAWSDSHALAKQWHSFGGIVGHYHFLHPGTYSSGTQQADWFWDHVNLDVAPSDFLIVDVETNGETNAEVQAFIDRVHEHAPNTRGLVYGPEYFLRDDAKARPAFGWGVWVADYSGGVDFIPPGWATWTAWQYTQSGSVPGVSGNVDISNIRRSLTEPTLWFGDKLFPVVNAKRALQKAGYKGFVINNDYGWGFRRAVHSFKKRHGYVNTSGRFINQRFWNDIRNYM